MSLDETHEALIQFARQLGQFDERLRANRAQLAERHAAIDGIWRDSLRAQYDRELETLDGELRQYADTRSERFEMFLQQKIAQLRDYLHG